MMAETPASPAAEERVAILQGDRLCIKCGYNLSGQHIVREPHYSMLIVRCPECGTVASVQEYPLLGRWASRWAVVLAAIWLLMLLLLLFVPTIPLTAASYGLAHESLDPLVDRLGQGQGEWAKEHGVEIETPSWDWQRTGRTTHSRYTRIEDGWWSNLNQAAFLAENGGWLRLVDWWILRYWSFAAIAMVAYGAIWSLMLPHVRRRWLPAVSILVLGVCVVYWMFPSGMWGRWGPSDLEDAAMEMIGPRVALALIMIGWMSCVVGLMIGRSATRLAVRALLPPRLRGALAPLWGIDGLAPPHTGSTSCRR